MLGAKVFSRELRMTKLCRAGLSDGTITTPKDALLAMGSKILLSSTQSVGSTRLPVWDVILEEHRRQFELLGDRSGASMPMKPAAGSPEDMKVRPAFLPHSHPNAHRAFGLRSASRPSDSTRSSAMQCSSSGTTRRRMRRLSTN